jgi:hypothetical protein
MRSILPLCSVVFILCIGCGPSNSPPRFSTVGSKTSAEAKKSLENLAPEFADANKKATEPTPEFVLLQEPAEQGVVGGGQKKAKAEPLRKIRYTADLRLIVEEFSKAEKELETAIDDAKGRLANSEFNSAGNTTRTGTWRVRVPVDNLASFRAAVAKIGEVERNSLDSEDLTDRYYDLEAHIKNRSAEREALRDLLKEVGKKEIKYYLEIKRELDSVTDDINRKEGQLRLWANLTDLTTCTVHLREKQKYIAAKPPEVAETPTFGMRAERTWGESWENFLGFCQGLVLIVVALVPWVPVVAALLGGVWLVSRRIVGARNAPIEVTVVPETPAKPT